jgi:hypothetical protein
MWDMSSYKFEIGQLVMAQPLGVPTGPYIIVRRLPLVRKEPHYHAKDDGSGTVRAFLESQLRQCESIAANEDVAPVKPRRMRGRR